LPKLNGDRLQVRVVEVDYGLRESSPVHSHSCPVIVYVLAGTVKTQVEGEPEAIYKAGETFYEGPKWNTPRFRKRQPNRTGAIHSLFSVR
jgi:quercetin dioxygenase-like cupin family protein